MKKEDFLNKLRKNTHVQFDMPSVEIKGIQYEDTLQQFVAMSLSVGAQVMRASKDDDMLNEIVRMAYPQAKVLPAICQIFSWKNCRLLLLMGERMKSFCAIRILWLRPTN